MEWIKCSERMPNKNIAVLVWDNSGKARIGYLDDGMREYRFNSESNIYELLEAAEFRWRCDEFMTIWDVTHWMPLPQPPKDKNGMD